MIINKKTMELGAIEFLNILFQLPEIEKVAIKDTIITSISDKNIKKALDECYHDNLSDVDFSAWIKLNPDDFNSTTPIYKKYFSRLKISEQVFGVIFQERTDSITNKEGLRIILNNGFRMDFTCYTRCDESAKKLPSVDLLEVHRDQDFLNIGQELDRVNSFWFISIQALAKLLRGDYLISAHLSHMLIMEGLVVQMMERDNKYNASFHRYGYHENLRYSEVGKSFVNTYKVIGDDTYNHIADNLIRAVLSFDELIFTMNPQYKKRSNVFFEIWDSYRLGEKREDV